MTAWHLPPNKAYATVILSTHAASLRSMSTSVSEKAQGLHMSRTVLADALTKFFVLGGQIEEVTLDRRPSGCSGIHIRVRERFKS